MPKLTDDQRIAVDHSCADEAYETSDGPDRNGRLRIQLVCEVCGRTLRDYTDSVLPSYSPGQYQP